MKMKALFNSSKNWVANELTLQVNVFIDYIFLGKKKG